MRRTLVMVAGATLLLAGCGDTEKDAKGYPADARKRFVDTCAGVITGQQDTTKAAAQCDCTFTRIEGVITYARYQELDKALSDGDRLDPQLEKTLRDAISGCAPS